MSLLINRVNSTSEIQGEVNLAHFQAWQGELVLSCRDVGIWAMDGRLQMSSQKWEGEASTQLWIGSLRMRGYFLKAFVLMFLKFLQCPKAVKRLTGLSKKRKQSASFGNPATRSL
ncbi:uncharacterized protein LOC143442220 [Arvicanthis niloticus]|uniref:uncharacterized protein LOC143312451 n=1 Tax=Arvicanthis niloticus TaxID=61156 RepID=UPI00402B8274